MQPVKNKFNDTSIKWVLRIEGIVMLILSTFAFSYFNTSWTMFLVLFLIPDIALIGYLFGKKSGAMFYNITHSLIGPIVLTIIGLILEMEIVVSISLIWIAHISFDRALGFGLKYNSGFKDTHLGVVGK